MNTRRNRIALALVALPTALALASCTSSGDNSSDKTDRSSASASPTASAAPKHLDNPYLPEDLLSVKDAQKLMPNIDLKGSECYEGKLNDDRLFPTNVRICDFSTSAEPAFVRIATILDSKSTDFDYVDHSGLLADTGGTTGRFAIGEHVEGLPPYSANVYVACDNYKISDGKECPFPGEAKTADRIVFTVEVPNSNSSERVTVIIGIAGEKRHDISVGLLDTAAMTALKNLKQEFNK